jgi:hypothetical protein
MGQAQENLTRRGLVTDSPPSAEHGPHYGFTRHGLPVHLRTVDHHPGGFNKRIAIGLTGQVGTMRTFWYFNVLSLLSLPATLVLVGFFAAPKSGPLHFFLTFGWIYLITWICQNYIQLVLLPALMVGQNLQNAASDARSAKQFEDVEAVRTDLGTAVDRLDTHTAGGITDVLTAVRDVHATLLTMRPGEGGASDVQ